MAWGRTHGGGWRTAGFGAVTRDEKYRADLFFADLMQQRARARLRPPRNPTELRLPPPTEHDITGVRPLRPGVVGPAVDGRVNAAHIALAPPSGAFDEPPAPSQLAAMNARIPTFQAAFAAAGHARVTLDFAPHEPSPRHRDEAGFHFAGTDAQRWAALRWALFDRATTAVLPTRGGHGATRLLDELTAHIAHEMNQQGHRWPRIPPVHEVFPPKRIVGFSDFTAVLLVAYNCLGWASLHGPMLCCSNAASRTRLIRALTVAPGDLDPGNVVDARLTLVGARPPNPIRGVLLGGNLSLVDALYGSPFFPSLQGGLLFVEEINEEGRKIDRMIEGLKQRGAADQARAVVVGQVVATAGHRTITPNAVATLFRRSWNVPVVFGLRAGHGRTNRALWIGLEYELQFPAAGGASLILRP
jgi:muramoyltetrapeptide carboxypeptidase